MTRTGNVSEGLCDQAASLLTRIPKTEVETEMPGLITENVYLGALALVNEATLSRVTVSRSNGRRTAVFEFEGPQLERVAEGFYKGDAIVNLAAYREKLERLKDQLFAALAEDQMTETKRRQDHDQDHRRHTSSRR
jgi:hypothetical protein